MTDKKKIKARRRTVEYSVPLLPITLLFIVLKLFGAITWGWEWVLSPLWVPYASVAAVVLLWFALAFVSVGIGLIVAAVGEGIDRGRRKR